MKKIKFRGISKCDNLPVFGDLEHYNNQVYIDDYVVYPESVAQFVGYDADGKEIYDGDKVHGISGTMVGHTFTARLAGVAQSTNGMYWGFSPEDVRIEREEN